MWLISVCEYRIISAQFVAKIIFFLFKYLIPSSSKNQWMRNYKVYFWTLNSIPLINVAILKALPSFPDHYHPEYILKLWSVTPTISFIYLLKLHLNQLYSDYMMTYVLYFGYGNIRNTCKTCQGGREDKGYQFYLVRFLLLLMVDLFMNNMAWKF